MEPNRQPWKGSNTTWASDADPGFLTVGDARQELVIGAAADLVHADEHQPVRPGVIQEAGDDPPEHLADRLPRDPHISFVTSVWDICCASRAHRQCSSILKPAAPQPEQTGFSARSTTVTDHRVLTEHHVLTGVLEARASR